jgi:hypothetical protein
MSNAAESKVYEVVVVEDEKREEDTEVDNLLSLTPEEIRTVRFVRSGPRADHVPSRRVQDLQARLLVVSRLVATEEAVEVAAADQKEQKEVRLSVLYAELDQLRDEVKMARAQRPPLLTAFLCMRKEAATPHKKRARQRKDNVAQQLIVFTHSRDLFYHIQTYLSVFHTAADVPVFGDDLAHAELPDVFHVQRFCDNYAKLRTLLTSSSSSSTSSSSSSGKAEATEEEEEVDAVFVDKISMWRDACASRGLELDPNKLPTRVDIVRPALRHGDLVLLDRDTLHAVVHGNDPDTVTFLLSLEMRQRAEQEEEEDAFGMVQDPRFPGPLPVPEQMRDKEANEVAHPAKIRAAWKEVNAFLAEAEEKYAVNDDQRAELVAALGPGGTGVAVVNAPLEGDAADTLMGALARHACHLMGISTAIDLTSPAQSSVLHLMNGAPEVGVDATNTRLLPRDSRTTYFPTVHGRSAFGAGCPASVRAARHVAPLLRVAFHAAYPDGGSGRIARVAFALQNNSAPDVYREEIEKACNDALKK